MSESTPLPVSPPAATPATPAAPAAPAAPSSIIGDAKAPVAAAPATPATPAAPAKAAEPYKFSSPKDAPAFDADVLTTLGATAQELGITNEAAQKLLDKMAPVVEARHVAALNASADKMRADWAAESKADPEFGGSKFDANAALAKKALDQFGSPELTAWLNETGVGNKNVLLKWAAKVGAAISDDTFVAGTATAPAEVSAAKVFFPTMA